MRFARALAGMLLLLTGIPALLAGGALRLVSRPDLTMDLRAEARTGWWEPVTWGLLGAGALLVALALALLLRPVRPREVVFVVEPDQVPVLAGRLGVTSLSALGAGNGPFDVEPAGEPPVAALGPGPRRPRLAIDAAPPARPDTLADPPPGSRLITSVRGHRNDPDRYAERPRGGARPAVDPARRSVRRRLVRRGVEAPVPPNRPRMTLNLPWPPLAPERTARPRFAPFADDRSFPPGGGTGGAGRGVGPGANAAPPHETVPGRRRNSARPAHRGRNERL